jgi:hypothetical protein
LRILKVRRARRRVKERQIGEGKKQSGKQRGAKSNTADRVLMVSIQSIHPVLVETVSRCQVIWTCFARLDRLAQASSLYPFLY